MGLFIHTNMQKHKNMTSYTHTHTHIYIFTYIYIYTKNGCEKVVYLLVKEKIKLYIFLATLD